MEESESAKSLFDDKALKRSATQAQQKRRSRSTFQPRNSEDRVAGLEKSQELSAKGGEDPDRQDTSLFAFEDGGTSHQVNEFRHDPDRCVDYEKLNKKSDFADVGSLLDELFEKAPSRKDDLVYEVEGMWNSASRP